MKTSSSPFTGIIDPAWRIGIVASSFYKEEIDSLQNGAVEALAAAGISQKNILCLSAPGSFEIPLIGAVLAETKKVDALIGLGIIIEGETHHARLLADQVAAGIMETQLKYNLPFAFEVLYVDQLWQARQRSSGEGNKGSEAAYAVLHSLATLKAIRAGNIE